MLEPNPAEDYQAVAVSVSVSKALMALDQAAVNGPAALVLIDTENQPVPVEHLMPNKERLIEAIVRHGAARLVGIICTTKDRQVSVLPFVKDDQIRVVFDQVVSNLTQQFLLSKTPDPASDSFSN